MYCHGNGEQVADLTARLKILHEQVGVSVFAWDYRSYGRSQGTPHEKNVLADAQVAHQWLANRTALSPAEIVLMGRSLGGAVAVALAANHPVRSLILDRTFSDLPDAASHNFPWLPVRWIMRNQFPSIQRIANYTGPLLQFHGTADEVVPFEQGRQLFDAAPSQSKKFIRVPDLDHNTPLPESCYQALIDFLNANQGLGHLSQKQIDHHR